MMLRKLISFALLIHSTTALVNCSGENSCCAESPECDPKTECQTVLHFDPSGNVDIYVRNVSVTDYVSIVTHRDLLNTMEFFICIPFYGQRLRGLGRTGQTILFNQQNLTNVVERLDQNFFRCIINANEVESDFRQNGNFIVARGKFQQFLKVNEGVKLYKVDQEETDNMEDDLEKEHIIPMVFNITAPIAKIDESPILWKEDPKVSGILRNLENYLFYHAQSLRALDIVEALNASDRLSKKQHHQKRSNGKNDHQISRDFTPADEGNVLKNGMVHKNHHMNSDLKKNVSRHHVPNLKRVKTSGGLKDDLNEKVYVRMTKGQMYSFVDRLENPNVPKNFTNDDVIVNHDDDDEEVHVLMTKGQMYTFVDQQTESKTLEKQHQKSKKSQSGQDILQGTTLVDEGTVPRKKQVHNKKHSLPNLEKNKLGHRKSIKNQKNETIHNEDLREEVYVRMTKQQMHSFLDGQENSDALKNVNNKKRVINKGDDEEEVHVLMTKGEMYAFVDKQAERSTFNPKTMPIKTTNGTKYIVVFLIVAMFSPFWQLFVDLV